MYSSYWVSSYSELFDINMSQSGCVNIYQEHEVSDPFTAKWNTHIKILLAFLTGMKENFGSNSAVSNRWTMCCYLCIFLWEDVNVEFQLCIWLMSGGNQHIYLTDILFPWLLGTKLTVGPHSQKAPSLPWASPWLCWWSSSKTANLPDAPAPDLEESPHPPHATLSQKLHLPWGFITQPCG